MKKGMLILRWVAVAFFGMMTLGAIGSGAIVSALAFALGAGLLLPLKPIQELRAKLKLRRWVSILLVVVLLFVGSVTMPSAPETSETPGTDTSVSAPGDTQTEQGNGGEIGDTPGSSENVIPSQPSGNETPTPSQPSGTELQKPSEPSSNPTTPDTPSSAPSTPVGSGAAAPVTPSGVPAYSGKAYATINGNTPNFSSAELTTAGYEKYSPLDALGRCGVAVASCGKEIMPADGEERGSISSIKPTGWIQAKYSGISGGYLWNRCHLIGWQLSAENANKQNLITGTRYMNVDGMLPFENMVADYIKETGNHVAYRITPIFEGNNLVCSGVQMEAFSIEDKGTGICFNVYCYNVQPGITINYATGASSGPSTETPAPSEPSTPTTPETPAPSVPVVPEPPAPSNPEPSTPSEPSTPTSQAYVLNTNTKKFHYPSCHHTKKIKAENWGESSDSRDALIGQGYSPCGTCKP